MATLTDTSTRMDDAVRADLMRELEWDPQITSNDIGVSVNDGVVTLSGFVSSYMEKLAAERAARRVQGVRAVANDLEVKFTSQRTDPEIARDVVKNVENHVFLPADKITVTVRDGWVSLDGTVNWNYQRELAQDSAKGVKGVRGITNNIMLKSRISTSDVKSKIEDALQRNARLDARNISVQAEESAVTLSGTVRSFAEKEEASDAAWSSPGVMSVTNEIEVVP